MRVGAENATTVPMLTEFSVETNALLAKLNLLHLFASPPKWAAASVP
jgi:hypothetical protein